MSKEYYAQTKDGFVFTTSNPEFWKDCEVITAKDGKRLQAQHAKEQLLNLLDEGDTVYTVLRHCSASGMTRRIDLYTFKDNKKVYLTGLYALMRGERPPKDGLKVSGCGMDMGFHLVYTMGRLLFEGAGDNGYKLNHEWI